VLSKHAAPAASNLYYHSMSGRDATHVAYASTLRDIISDDDDDDDDDDRNLGCLL
jgi:hypothetical protein